MAEAAAFSADVAQAVCHHMDTDHPVAALRIVQVLGGLPEAAYQRLCTCSRTCRS